VSAEINCNVGYVIMKKEDILANW